MLSTRPTRRQWLRYQFPLAMGFVLGGMALSWHYYPGHYDWRYQVVCYLISQVDNPSAYIYFCVGLLVAFTFLLPLPGYLRDRLLAYSPRTARVSSVVLLVGFLGAIGVGTEKVVFRNLSSIYAKGHEYIALVAFLGMFFGVAGLWFALVKYARHRRGWSAWRMGALFALSIGPMVGAAVSQGYLYYFPNDLGWVGPHWAARGVPVYYSCAFWEWLASAGVFIYLYLLIYLLPATPRGD
jgi:hypothetical protein